MKCCFINAGPLSQGIELVKNDLGIEIARENDAELTVTVNRVSERTLSVVYSNGHASITYGDGKARFFRGLAMLVGWINDGLTQNSVTEAPLFKTNGPMLQETTVMKPETVKTIFRKIALLGMNACLFYMEDTYELTDHPYFGHMRGRYSRAELKELDAYALALGIELIPCIQTLGHLASHLRWDAATVYKDTATVLLADADETYALIDDMLKTVSSCFTTRRIHIGMDETSALGTGRYLRKNGYRDRRDIYFAHLERVKAMVLSYGLDPMMWSDMFFRMAGDNLPGFEDFDTRVTFPEDYKEKTPKGVHPVFWDYYHSQQSFYEINIDKHRALFGEDPLFAGGVWCWSGHCPLYSRSLEFSVPALDACRSKGIDQVFATVWGGGDLSLVMSLPGLAWYADYDYRGSFDPEGIRESFRYACGGVSYDSLMLCELPQHPDGSKLSLTTALLYNDPLLGLADRHIGNLPLGEYYRDVTRKLEADTSEKGIFALSWDVILKLSSLLENKADFGLRLKAAYDKGDRAALAELLAECDVILQKLTAFRKAHRYAWTQLNKPFDWVEYDLRYGGLAARFDTVKEVLRRYLSGETPSIPELEEDRLRLVGSESDPLIGERFLWMRQGSYATVN